MADPVGKPKYPYRDRKDYMRKYMREWRERKNGKDRGAVDLQPESQGADPGAAGAPDRAPD